MYVNGLKNAFLGGVNLVKGLSTGVVGAAKLGFGLAQLEIGALSTTLSLGSLSAMAKFVADKTVHKHVIDYNNTSPAIQKAIMGQLNSNQQKVVQACQITEKVAPYVPSVMGADILSKYMGINLNPLSNFSQIAQRAATKPLENFYKQALTAEEMVAPELFNEHHEDDIAPADDIGSWMY
jgi:hypothetical protein